MRFVLFSTIIVSTVGVGQSSYNVNIYVEN